MGDKIFVLILTFFAFVAGIFFGITGVLVFQELTEDDTKNVSITNYEECAAAGGIILEKYPPVCQTEDGKQFTQDVPPVIDPAEPTNPDQSDIEYYEHDDFYGSSTRGACSANSDCQVGGCNTEICSAKSQGDLASICIGVLDQDLPKEAGYSCGCVQKQCQWAK